MVWKERYNVTDSEILKALECCNADRNECDKCALQEECESNPFYSTIAKYALDLLKRQKTEIERLKSMNQAKLDCIHDLQKENEILSRNADTAFQDGLNERRDVFAPEIKAEAYKELINFERGVNIMKTCKDCLHYKACKDYGVDEVCEELSVCKQFTDRSEWVHLPSDDYTFRIRGDIAKGIIVANCRNAEEEG